MNYQNFVFLLILVKVLSTQDSNVKQSSEELSRIFNKDINNSILSSNASPLVGPYWPENYPKPTLLTTLIPTIKPINIDLPQLDAQELLKIAYKGCINLFEAVVIIFTSLFQDMGLLAPNGLIALLLYPGVLGPGGPTGQFGLLSQLLYWVFRKDGILGPQGLFSVLIGGLVGCLKKLESEGMKGIGYFGVK